MFGKQTKKKVIEKEIPVVEESVDLEIEDIKQEQDTVIEEEEVKEKIIPTVASAQDKIKQLEQELQEAKAKALEEEEPKDFMTVSAIELIGKEIYKYTLIATKPVWEIGTVLKL